MERRERGRREKRKEKEKRKEEKEKKEEGKRELTLYDASVNWVFSEGEFSVCRKSTPYLQF